jgi:hypothetical protein
LRSSSVTSIRSRAGSGATYQQPTRRLFASGFRRGLTRSSVSTSPSPV